MLRCSIRIGNKLVHEMQRELFGKADCIACSNCCKVIVPVLSNDDVRGSPVFSAYPSRIFEQATWKMLMKNGCLTVSPVPSLLKKAAPFMITVLKCAVSIPLQTRTNLYPGCSI